MTAQTFDVIVLGVGSMGAPTCLHLASRGYAVLGIEQFDLAHDQGSHAGQSRIIRKAYFEHPDYVPLLERAYQGWAALERQTGAQFYFPTGLLYAGRPEGVLMQGVRTSAQQHGIAIEQVSQSESKHRFPAFQLPADYEVLFEPDAGFVTPERAVLAFAEEAMKQGAIIRTRERVLAWKRDADHLSVQTDRAQYQCNRLVITAGPWAGHLIPGLKERLQVTRQVVAWALPNETQQFALGKFPCWLIDDDARAGMLYGFPQLPAARFGGPLGLKLAHHFPGVPVDPNKVNRQVEEREELELTQALSLFLPALGQRFQTVKTCLYTNTPDENFVIDLLPGYDDRVAIACGFSGHGFKFAPAIGELLADLVQHGRTNLPISFLRLGR
jgi:sarcosine oxidase